MSVKLTEAKADEWREAFPDGRIPVTSLRMDYDPAAQTFYYHVDLTKLTEQQKAFSVEIARSRTAIPSEATDDEILAMMSIKQQDTCCPDCGTEGKHNCQAPSTVYEQIETEEDWDEEEFGERPPFFANMPWISDNLGSMLEHQLTQYRQANQCRQCGKIDEALRTKKIEERFCSEGCRRQWRDLLDIRIKQGEYDLRTRGYD